MAVKYLLQVGPAYEEQRKAYFTITRSWPTHEPRTDQNFLKVQVSSVRKVGEE